MVRRGGVHIWCHPDPPPRRWRKLLGGPDPLPGGGECSWGVQTPPPRGGECSWGVQTPQSVLLLIYDSRPSTAPQVQINPAAAVPTASDKSFARWFFSGVNTRWATGRRSQLVRRTRRVPISHISLTGYIYDSRPSTALRVQSCRRCAHCF